MCVKERLELNPGRAGKDAETQVFGGDFLVVLVVLRCFQFSCGHAPNLRLSEATCLTKTGQLPVNVGDCDVTSIT